MPTLKNLPKEYPVINSTGHCGVAIIEMILRAYGRDTHGLPLEHYPQRTLKEKVLASVFQSMLLSTLEEVLRNYGFKVEVLNHTEFRRGYDQFMFLRRSVRENKRVILLVRLKGKWFLPHYVSVEGYSEENFFIYDPSVKNKASLCPGNRVVSNKTLIEWWKSNPIFLLGPKNMRGTVALVVQPN